MPSDLISIAASTNQESTGILQQPQVGVVGEKKGSEKQEGCSLRDMASPSGHSLPAALGDKGMCRHTLSCSMAMNPADRQLGWSLKTGLWN